MLLSTPVCRSLESFPNASTEFKPYGVARCGTVRRASKTEPWLWIYRTLLLYFTLVLAYPDIKTTAHMAHLFLVALARRFWKPATMGVPYITTLLLSTIALIGCNEYFGRNSRKPLLDYPASWNRYYPPEKGWTLIDRPPIAGYPQGFFSFWLWRILPQDLGNVRFCYICK